MAPIDRPRLFDEVALTVVIFAGLFAIIDSASATPASASCFGTAVVSAHPFAGTVAAGERQGPHGDRAHR